MLKVGEIQPGILKHEALDYLVSNMATILLVANASALMLAGVLYHRVPHILVEIWLLALWVVSVFRWFQTKRYQFKPMSAQQAYPRFLTSTVVASLVWGAGVMSFLPYLEPFYQALILFLLAVMGAQACVKMPKDVFAIFLFGVGVPSALWLLCSGEKQSIELGMVYTAGIVMLWLASARFHQSLLSAITSGINNRKLVDEMATYAQACKQLDDGVLVMSDSGMVEYANAAYCRQMKVKEQDLIGSKSPMFAVGLDVLSEQEAAQLWRHIAQGESWSSRLMLPLPTEKNPFLVTVSPVYDAQKELAHLVSVQKDMQGYEKLESELAHAKRLESIGTMTSGVAHDFNNILSAIGCATFFIRKDTANFPHALEYTQKIDDLVQQGAAMIADLMAFARKDELEFQAVDLKGFLQTTLAQHMPTMPKSIKLDVDVSDADVQVQLDTAKMQQVLCNLLNNAADAMQSSENQRLVVRVESGVQPPEKINVDRYHTQGFVCIHVQDVGSGMPEEVREHIFEPFFTTKAAGKGTGLGLAMAYGTVQSHHGVLTVDSREGEGSCFHIYLPY